MPCKAAERLLVRLLKKQGLAPKRIITDKLRSYGAARRQVMPAVEHRSHKGLNNRAENSHLPFRKRERTRQGFRSIRSLQQFVSIYSAVRNHFVPANQIAPLPRSDPSVKPQLPNGGRPRCNSPEIHLAASTRPHGKQRDSTLAMVTKVCRTVCLLMNGASRSTISRDL